MTPKGMGPFMASGVLRMVDALRWMHSMIDLRPSSCCAEAVDCCCGLLLLWLRLWTVQLVGIEGV